MDTQYPSHSLIDFWKVPVQVVSFQEQTLSGQVKILMPAQTNLDKAQLHTWGGINFYSPCGKESESIIVNEANREIILPFHLDQNVRFLILEEYQKGTSDHHLLRLLRKIYYLFKPLIPRRIQIAIRQTSVKRFKKTNFPAWPIDLSVDRLHFQVLKQVLSLLQPPELPMIGFWPGGAQYAAVLTHDVEQRDGIQRLEKIIDLETRHGFRSAWNFVPERYAVDLLLLRRLQAEGFEVGVHGLLHDGREFESYKTFHERASRINQYAEQWGSVGFRSPSNLRDLNWIGSDLKFEYDTSCLSCERYGAQPGGSCTVFPFIFQGMVELPITLQQDFTLLEILKMTPQQVVDHWIETIEIIKKHHGLALINVHPDYMTTPERLAAYERFLQYLSQEQSCWCALPSETAQWWRARHASELIWGGQEWCIQGPAAEHGRAVTVSLVDGEIQVSIPDSL